MCILCCSVFTTWLFFFVCFLFFFFQAEDGIRDLVGSRGLGDVYKRQAFASDAGGRQIETQGQARGCNQSISAARYQVSLRCLLYTSDAADERSSVDLGGRRIIKKKKRRVISAKRTR